MFRNQLNCCKYKSLSSSCSTEHRAKYCERQAEHATQPWTTAWETHTPATSKSETLNSKRKKIERVRKREKKDTQTHAVYSSHSVVDWNEWKTRSVVWVRVCIVSVWCSLRVFRLQWFKHSLSIWQAYDFDRREETKMLSCF